MKKCKSSKKYIDILDKIAINQLKTNQYYTDVIKKYISDKDNPNTNSTNNNSNNNKHKHNHSHGNISSNTNNKIKKSQKNLSTICE